MPAPSRSESNAFRQRCRSIQDEENVLRQGGGDSGHERQRRHGRLPVRERLSLLVDHKSYSLELGLWAAYGMYEEWGRIAAAGVITGIGPVSGRPCMLIANDATVKAGALFPQSVKKLLRAQRIAFECSLPIIYLVDSSGVFLPLQDEVFPDEDDFGRIFRNNAVLSAAGIPQYAAIMGNCVAGGAYLPVLCDKILMTEGSGLYLAGPALVKAAIGQDVDPEELGGSKMHAEISGTIDFHEPNDEECLRRLRKLVGLLPRAETGSSVDPGRLSEVESDPDLLFAMVSLDGRREYDSRQLLACIVDAGSMDEYKASYGRSLVTIYATIGGAPVGIVASQRVRTRSERAGIQMASVIYSDGAEKAARFIMDCNQTGLPIIFFQDVVGFMVGRDAEQSGIIRSGAKLVNTVSNSIVPKITVIVGGSFGAGNYALCGKAYDPRFIFAWPGAKYAVMGPDQASDTLVSILTRSRKLEDEGEKSEDLEKMRETVRKQYEVQSDIRYGAARGWVDAIIQPDQTREVLITVLDLVKRKRPEKRFHSGVLQV